MNGQRNEISTQGRYFGSRIATRATIVFVRAAIPRLCLLAALCVISLAGCVERKQQPASGASASAAPVKQDSEPSARWTATIDTEWFEREGEPGYMYAPFMQVSGFPGQALSLADPDWRLYGLLHAKAALEPKEFTADLGKGTYALLPNGAEVEVMHRGEWPEGLPVQSQEALLDSPFPLWLISYEGKEWWLLGAHLRDQAGELMDHSYGAN